MDFFTEAEVKEAVEDLPEQFRMAVLLADIEGFSYKEIAEILDIPIGTVMSRLHRGRKALQKRLYDFAVSRGLAEPVPDPSLAEPWPTESTPLTPQCDEALHEIYHLLSRRDRRRQAGPDRRPPRRLRPCAEPYDFDAELRRCVQQRCHDTAPPELLARIEAGVLADTSRDDLIPVAPSRPGLRSHPCSPVQSGTTGSVWPSSSRVLDPDRGDGGPVPVARPSHPKYGRDD